MYVLDDTLAEPTHARLLSRLKLLPVLTRRHARGRHWLLGIHMGNDDMNTW